MTKRSGFTLMEALLVLAILAILAAILFPVFATTGCPSRQTSCISQMKQISLAAQQYAQDYDGRLPDSSLQSVTKLPAWVAQTDPYIKNQQAYYCPSDSAKQRSDYSKPAAPNEYAASYSLNKWTTFGLKIAAMKDPAAFVLAAERNNETQKPDAPYLFAGWNWQENNGISAPPGKMAPGQDAQAAKVLALKRHSNGAVWAFADGHAKWRKFQNICAEGRFRL